MIPNSFAQPIPDTRELSDSVWQQQTELVGIDINEPGQLEILSSFADRFKSEYEKFPREQTNIPYQYHVNNPFFISVDGEVLYCTIRHFKPRRIFEIGSGNSTYLAAQAVLKNQSEGNSAELVAFEPYPNDMLKTGFPGLSKLMTTRIEHVPLSEFSKLQENDILFIDSSHSLKINSDVQFEILEIIPRLNKGVIVHLHDIFLPSEYPRDWVLKDHLFYNEQYLLQAFLAFNESFQVLWAGSFMHVKHSDKLKLAFNSYKGAWPGSFWMRKVR